MPAFNSLDSSASIALFALALILTAWLLVTYQRLRRLESRLDDLLADVSDQNVAQMLTEYLSKVRRTASDVTQLQASQQEMARLMPSVIRHVGVVRFSPFRDTGGDQSFALALLDGRGDGVVVTALHSRTDSRLYAKPVEHEKSAYSLTPEEREAMAIALGHSRATAGS